MTRETPVTDADIEAACEVICEQIREGLAAEGVDLTGWDNGPVQTFDGELVESD